MNKSHIVRKLVKKIAEELKLKSSNHYPSDADLYVGFKFGDDQQTANESEYDPKTGEVIHNTSIGDYPTYLQQWDTEPEGYLEGEDVVRDNGVGYQKLATMFLKPIKK